MTSVNSSAGKPCLTALTIHGRCQQLARNRWQVQARQKGRSAVACQAGSNFNNQIGVHALVWCGGWSREEVKRAVEGTNRTGYDLIEVPLLEPETVDVTMTRELLEEYDLSASSSLGLTFETDISSEDNTVVQRGKDLLKTALEATAGFGGKHMVGVTYSALAKYSKPVTRQSWSNCRDALKEVGARAADLGLMLGLEVVNRYETNVLNTAAQAMEMISEVGLDNVTVHLDTYHMNIEERSMQDAVSTCGDRLGYVHIGESHRGYLGTGSVDLPGCFRALAAAGYRGPITFESFSSEVVSPSLSNNLCVWRNLWEDSEDLARHSRSYIGSHWEAAQRIASTTA